MWVDERDVEAHGAGAGVIRADGIVVVLEAEGHGLPVEDEGTADASTDWYSPALTAVCVPVGGDAGSGGQRPTLSEVVVDEVLPQEVVNARRSARVVHWGELHKEGAQDEGARRCQQDDGGADGPGAGLSRVRGRGGKREGRADAVDELARVGWGEEGLLLDVAYTAVADAVAGGDADDRDDGAGDIDELRGEMDGNDGLEVEIEEGLVLVGAAGVEVELEGD